jgi:type VI protein secretion system component Hcp
MDPKSQKKDKDLKTAPEVDKSKDELSEDDLEAVSGGKVHLQDIHFTKNVDKASPILF